MDRQEQFYKPKLPTEIVRTWERPIFSQPVKKFNEVNNNSEKCIRHMTTSAPAFWRTYFWNSKKLKLNLHIHSDISQVW
jgi:hypothetical protein